MCARVRTTDPREFDPFRRPGWRWDLAGRIACGELPRRRGLDEVLCAAVAFRRRERTSGGRRHRRGQHDAAIAAALELHRENGPRRWEIEARILANEASSEIARKCDISLDVLRCFEDLFFAVRPHRAAWVWVCSQVIGPGLRRGFANHELGRVWAALAYFGGPAVIDQLVAALPRGGRKKRPNLSAYLAGASQAPLGVQAVVAMLSLGWRYVLAWEFCELHLKLLEIDTRRSEDARRRATERLARRVVCLARRLLTGRAVPQEAKKPGDTRHEPPGTRPPAEDMVHRIQSWQAQVVEALAACLRQIAA